MKHFLFVLIVLGFLFASCKEDITNNIYTNETEEKLDVNIVSANYEIKTIHSSHIDTFRYSQYYYVLSFDVKLDKPENRNKISKLIIKSTQNTGWEFYQEDLEQFFSDSLGGYKLDNLILKQESNYSGLTDLFFNLKFIGKNFSESNELESVVKRDFFSPLGLSNYWETSEILKVTFSPYYTNYFPQETNLVWLDNLGNTIGSVEIDESMIINYEISINNVPNNAVKFYMYRHELYNYVSRKDYSEIYKIQNRFENKVKYLNTVEFIDDSYHIKTSNKIALLDKTSRKIKIVDFNNFEIEQESKIYFEPTCFEYDESKQSFYIGHKDGKIYSYNVEANQLNLEYSLNRPISSLLSLNSNFFIAAAQESLYVINSISKKVINKYYNFHGSVGKIFFNPKVNVVYGYTGGYSNVLRMTIDLSAGEITEINSKYTNYDYLALPVILFPEKDKFIYGNGAIFLSTADINSDFLYLGNLNQKFTSALFSDDKTYFISVTDNSNNYSDPISKLIINTLDFFEIKSITTFPNMVPLFVLNNNDIIKVILKNNKNKYLVVEYSISELIQTQALFKPINSKYYFSKKF